MSARHLRVRWLDGDDGTFDPTPLVPWDANRGGLSPPRLYEPRPNRWVMAQPDGTCFEIAPERAATLMLNWGYRALPPRLARVLALADEGEAAHRARPRAAIESAEPLAYRLDEVARLLGLSRRTLERERSAGRFPPPDRCVGRCLLWTRATLDAWLAGGGGR